MQSITHLKKIIKIVLFLFSATLLVGCSLFGGRRSARVALPTFTPTQSAIGNVNSVEGLVRPSNQTAQEGELIVVTQAPTLTLTPLPTPLPTMTPVPIATPVPLPTETQPVLIAQESTATSTILPTILPESTATPTLTAVPEILFDLEDYTKFPTV